MEKFIISPNIKLFVGETINEESKLDYISEDGTIEQHLENMVMTTKIFRTHETMGRKVIEEANWTMPLLKGDVLIFSNEEGWILPPYKMVTIPKVIEDLGYIKEV